MMRKSYMIIGLMALFSAQSVLAAETDKPCDKVAQACSAAGFEHTETAGKQFWFDCMKPIVLGKSVSGVAAVDKDVVHACRMQRITELKAELKELQKAKS